MFGSVPGVLLLYFMTNTLGISAGVATLVVVGPKIWDAISDPLMGIVSDRTRGSWGRRSPFLLAGAIGLGGTFPLLFNVPSSLSPNESAVYVLVAYVVVATAFTVFQIPYVSLAAELSEDSEERTRLLVWRMAFVTGGIGLGTAVAPMVVGWLGGGRYGYGVMSLGLGAVCGFFMLVSFVSTFRLGHAAPEIAPSIKEQFGRVADNSNFRALGFVYLMATTAVGLAGAAIPYYVGNVMREDEATTGVIFLVMLSAAFVSMPIWGGGARRIGKKRALNIALGMFAAAVGCILLVDLETGYVWASLLIVVGGAGFGGSQILCFAMLTDVIQRDEHETGKPAAGAYSGFWLVIDKLGPAAGAAILGTLLSFGGYAESLSGYAEQPKSALDAIQFSLSLAPAACAIVAILGLRFYRIDELELAKHAA